MAEKTFSPAQFLTSRQTEDLIRIFKENPLTPHKEMLKYIEDQPDLMAKLKQGVDGTELLPSYFAYALELAITKSQC